MSNNIFENIKHINEHHQEFWSARELMTPLGYARWENFVVAIARAKESCQNSGQSVEDHFRGVTKKINIATGTARETTREVDDYHLSRYACYLIAQNGDPRKTEIALAQSYFAIQTHRQELSEQLLEDQKRVSFREEITTRNKSLSQAAAKAGVVNANFQDFGYTCLPAGRWDSTADSAGKTFTRRRN